MRARLDSLAKTEASFVEPMECLSVSKLPEDNEWILEIKVNGYRALAVKSEIGVTLFSRRRKSLNRQFSQIVEALADLPSSSIKGSYAERSADCSTIASSRTRLAGCSSCRRSL